MSLRLDPHQRFACSQCGRCCHGFDVVVTEAEIDLYRRRNAQSWFRGTLSSPGTPGTLDPFEPIPGMPALQRIRKRDDGACGFLSTDNRCRIHEELGAHKKPLTCRLFPYAFHAAADGVVVTASFGCPTIVANDGPLIGSGAPLAGIEALREEWFAVHRPGSAALQFVEGRAMDTRSAHLLRQNLLAMLGRDSADIRDNIRRIASALDDLTRSRVLALSAPDFAEYISLTLPHAARQEAPPSGQPGLPRRSASAKAGWIARMLQYGFLYTVAAIRADLEHPGQSRTRLRLMRLQLLAHFHGLAPGLERVRVKALKRRRVDINDPAIRPIVFHYLRSTLETLGAHGRPIVDELSLAVSILNAACALAAMNADAAGRDVDRGFFIDALTEASDVSHARSVVLDWILTRLSAGTEAVWYLAAEVSSSKFQVSS